MNNKSLVSLVGILLLYLMWVAVVFVLPMSALGPTGSQDQQAFRDLFSQNALIVIGVSFVCMLVWFCLGEWVISAFAPSSTWYLSWFALLVMTIGTAIYMSFLGPQGESTDPVNYWVASYYLLGGFFSFYIASVLFSPTNAKYLIWPAKHLRRW